MLVVLGIDIVSIEEPECSDTSIESLMNRITSEGLPLLKEWIYWASFVDNWNSLEVAEETLLSISTLTSSTVNGSRVSILAKLRSMLSGRLLRCFGSTTTTTTALSLSKRGRASLKATVITEVSTVGISITISGILEV